MGCKINFDCDICNKNITTYLYRHDYVNDYHTINLKYEGFVGKTKISFSIDAYAYQEADCICKECTLKKLKEFIEKDLGDIEKGKEKVFK